MNRFKKHYHFKLIKSFISLPAVTFIILVTIFIFSASYFSNISSDNEKELLEKALKRSIVECYALEGSYPDSLLYIEKNYGLVYDTDKYFIDYQPIGKNIMPSYSVIAKNWRNTNDE
ncbi:hypothetical protein SAMN05216249_10782 [Acetitomaculum ruminis DSM 5522]|uniref:Sensor histidine kinase n=1 Tax=Acetitomaculum ruminis DSM 5522 TaxID=1120918 RepID=A0A1I0XS14_9FIRM|nr:hypothetical protein [Acetitomaculum ruminis]SFB03226.1 hypothetical protein SAMN05216249_10782 [Acetitomaculum ruminis DSM 5522]